MPPIGFAEPLADVSRITVDACPDAAYNDALETYASFGKIILLAQGDEIAGFLKTIGPRELGGEESCDVRVAEQFC